jgi:hypothetical protein
MRSSEETAENGRRVAPPVDADLSSLSKKTIYGLFIAKGFLRFLYRFDWPRVSFFTFCLLLPRGVVRLAFGAAFLRAARFTFLRSSLSVMLLVFAMCVSLSELDWGGQNYKKRDLFRIKKLSSALL